MAITEHASGTRTAGTPPEASFTALGTANDTNTGVYQFFINTTNLQGGATPDSIEVQVLGKVISSGTAGLIFEAVITGVQDEPIWASPALTLMHGWTLQMKQVAGTARTFEWSIRRAS